MFVQKIPLSQCRDVSMCFRYICAAVRSVDFYVCVLSFPFLLMTGLFYLTLLSFRKVAEKLQKQEGELTVTEMEQWKALSAS